MSLFGSSGVRNTAGKQSARVARVSSGWAALLKELSAADSGRVLDVGPTSSTNINFLTGLGHSIYMADLVGDLADPKWTVPEGEAFPAEAFVAANLQFSGRNFDTVLFWDAGDYLPPLLRDAVIDRMHQVMHPGGKVLAFFHVKPDEHYNRYHLRDDGQVDVQHIRSAPTLAPPNNRQIEQMFQKFHGHRFFLAKDNLREVLVTR